VSDTLELRPGRYDHPDAVALTQQAQQYYVGLYGGPDEDPLTADSMTPRSGGFLLGYLDGAAVAMGGWLWAPHAPMPGRVAQLRRMFVVSRLRGHGYGRALLSALEEDAAAHGAEAVALSTGRPQVEAIAFYRATGYLDIPAFGHYAESPGAVHLGKTL
jgi:GNAT superfamily N-acetyltransferase